MFQSYLYFSIYNIIINIVVHHHIALLQWHAAAGVHAQHAYATYKQKEKQKQNKKKQKRKEKEDMTMHVYTTCSTSDFGYGCTRITNKFGHWSNKVKLF